jgi:hypothetical protein
MLSDRYRYARARSIMNFDNCFRCGEPGHFASSCLARPAEAARAQGWHAPPRRYDQDEINARGAALCRELLARRTVAP